MRRLLPGLSLGLILVAAASAQPQAPPPTCEALLTACADKLDNKTFQCGQAAVLSGQSETELAQVRVQLRGITADRDTIRGERDSLRAEVASLKKPAAVKPSESAKP